MKMNILVNNEPVDALAFIVHAPKPIPRPRFMRAPQGPHSAPAFPGLQAAIGGKIIARETISALRKDVLAKCYGGDISRKRKLLDKQKKGKKKMREIGNVEIPQRAFLAALKMDSR